VVGGAVGAALRNDWEFLAWIGEQTMNLLQGAGTFLLWRMAAVIAAAVVGVAFLWAWDKWQGWKWDKKIREGRR
jgi:hypothetical protein